MCEITQETINGKTINKHSCVEPLGDDLCTVVVHDNLKVLHISSSYGILETMLEIYCQPTKEEAKAIAVEMGLEWPEEDNLQLQPI